MMLELRGLWDLPVSAFQLAKEKKVTEESYKKRDLPAQLD